MEKIVKVKQSLQGILRRMLQDTNDENQKEQHFERTQLQKTTSLEEKVLYPKINRLRQRRAVSVGGYQNKSEAGNETNRGIVKPHSEREVLTQLLLVGVGVD